MKRPWAYIGAMVASIAIAMTGIGFVHEWRMDYAFYQGFAESVARGQFDLSIPGFHGVDFLTAIWFWVSGSPNAHIHLQLVSNLLLPIVAFLAARSLYKSDIAGVLFAGVITISPFISMVYITGYTQAANILLFLLALYAAHEKKQWAWLPWAFAILTKPFALILLPFFVQKKKRERGVLMYVNLVLGLAVPALYWLAQYLQIGHIIIGVHPELNEVSIWTRGMKLLGNIAYAIQDIFSMHNFHYGNPGATPMESLVHVSPLLVMLGIFAFLAPQKYFADRWMHRSLLLAAFLGFALTSLVSINDYYMQFFILMVVLASLPVLEAHPAWIPFVLVTSVYQWFYLVLQYREHTTFGWQLFLPMIVVPGLFLVWCWKHRKKTFIALREVLTI